MSDGIDNVDVEFDENVHSKSSLLRVAYAMADRIALELQSAPGRYLLCGRASPGIDVTDLIAEIRVCAVDFALREEIEAKTSLMRDAIWRTAFAETASGAG